MDVEGRLTVRLAVDGTRVRAASVASTRPLAVPRVLAGRTPREAAAVVPMLYSVCAFAQGAAAAAALELAEGRALPDDLCAVRDLACVLEETQEHLRRLLVDVPSADGAPAHVEPVAAARRAIAPLLATLKPALQLGAPAPRCDGASVRAAGAGLRAIVQTHALGLPAAEFAGLRDADALRTWADRSATAPARVVARLLRDAPRLGASDVKPMPDPTPAQVERAVLAALDADDAFAQAPRWAGEPVETGPLARRLAHPALAALVAEHGGGVAARLVARLLELAATVEALADGRIPARLHAWRLREGEAAAGVHTARGWLLHRARVRDGRVASHAIVAPTEWNFHPQGALVRGLAGLRAADEAAIARDATLVVASLDPCVACGVELGRA